jgi:hypothetical protein
MRLIFSTSQLWLWPLVCSSLQITRIKIHF